MAQVTSVQIIDNSTQVKAAKDAAVAKALEMIGIQAEGYAKLLAPVDTGRLKNSITHTQEGDDTEIIGTDVEYGIYQEYGTVRMKAQPFLKPAVGNHIGEYKQIVENALKNA